MFEGFKKLAAKYDNWLADKSVFVLGPASVNFRTMTMTRDACSYAPAGAVHEVRRSPSGWEFRLEPSVRRQLSQECKARLDEKRTPGDLSAFESLVGCSFDKWMTHVRDGAPVPDTYDKDGRWLPLYDWLAGPLEAAYQRYLRA
jgi:hypothetical protein